MENNSWGLAAIKKRIEKDIEKGSVSAAGMLNMGKNLADMTKGTPKQNRDSFNKKLEEQSRSNEEIGDERS